MFIAPLPPSPHFNPQYQQHEGRWSVSRVRPGTSGSYLLQLPLAARPSGPFSIQLQRGLSNPGLTLPSPSLHLSCSSPSTLNVVSSPPNISDEPHPGHSCHSTSPGSLCPNLAAWPPGCGAGPQALSPNRPPLHAPSTVLPSL